MANKMENINDVEMEKNYTVYMHVCPNGKRYIGITSLKPKYRWKNGRGYKRNGYFYNAIQKYEWNNFEHIIIENNLTKEQAENMEIELIAKYRSNDREYGYNIESGGNCKGKASDETRKKMSDNNKGGNNPHAKKVYCDGMIFECILECANYYNVNRDTMHNWLFGDSTMNEDFQKLNLRYATENDLIECEKYDINKHGENASIVINIYNKGRSKFIHCDGLIFNSMKECANYYNVKYISMQNWLLGIHTMNEDFQKLNLRYATENDLNECEKYDINKHGDKANITININNGNFVHCDNLIFKSVQNCANYYNVNNITMQYWLLGTHTMNEDFQKLNLRYATENDLIECEKYDINKHGDKSNVVINVNKNNSKFIYCDNLIFNSIVDCAKYYNVHRVTMANWLLGKNKMRLDFQKLNLRYATNEDLNTYPRYTLENN